MSFQSNVRNARLATWPLVLGNSRRFWRWVKSQGGQKKISGAEELKLKSHTCIHPFKVKIHVFEMEEEEFGFIMEEEDFGLRK